MVDFSALVLMALIVVGASTLSVGACLVGMKSREATVQRWVALLVAAVVSLPLAGMGAIGSFYLAGFLGIGFASDFGFFFAGGGAAALAAVVGFTVGRLFSRPGAS